MMGPIGLSFSSYRAKQPQQNDSESIKDIVFFWAEISWSGKQEKENSCTWPPFKIRKLYPE